MDQIEDGALNRVVEVWKNSRRKP